MIKSILTGAAAGGLLLASASVGAQTSLSDLEISTKGGIKIKTADGQNSVQLVGRFMFDRDFSDGIYNANAPDNHKSEGEIRRSRLGVKGKVYGDWNYTFILNIDDGGSNDRVHEAFVRYTGFDAVDIWAGRFKRPVSMEVIASSKWITTIERGAIFDAIPANKHPDFGIMLSETLGENVAWYAGIFDGNGEADRNGEDTTTGRDVYEYHGRVVYTPLRRSTQVIHLGASFAEQSVGDGETTRVQSRGAVHTNSSSTFRFSDTVEIDSDRQFGVELAWMDGPFSLQAEYLTREAGVVGDPAVSELDVNGGYVQAAWTITGESRKYKFPMGAFDRISPTRASGAWEVVLKHDFIDVSNVGAGESNLKGVTAGANWYPNNNFKFALNYTRTSVDGLANQAIFGEEDNGDAITARMQFAF